MKLHIFSVTSVFHGFANLAKKYFFTFSCQIQKKCSNFADDLKSCTNSYD